MSSSSKYISYLLRHDKRIANLVDDYGFISLEDLNKIVIEDKLEKFTEQYLIEIVDNINTKKRFEYEFRTGTDSKSKFYIRALNGHSFALRTNIFEPWSPDSSSKKYIYHVTNRHLVKSIMKEGLKPMARQFIHLYEDKHQVNYDKKRDTLLEIGPINNQDLKLFRSKNGYIMCPHVIPATFVKPIIN